MSAQQRDNLERYHERKASEGLYFRFEESPIVIGLAAVGFAVITVLEFGSVISLGAFAFLVLCLARFFWSTWLHVLGGALLFSAAVGGVIRQFTVGFQWDDVPLILVAVVFSLGALLIGLNSALESRRGSEHHSLEP